MFQLKAAAAALFLAWPCGAKNIPEPPAYLLALKSYQQGDFKTSLTQADEAIESQPRFYAAYALRAKLWALSDDRQSMKKDADHILSKLGSSTRWLGPDDLLAQGTALLIAGRANDAFSSFEKILESAPDSPEALAGRARVLQDEGKSEAALSDLNALVAHAAFPAYYYDRASFYYDGGQIDAALGDLISALRLNPKFYPAYGLLGAVLIKRNDPARAREAYGKALALNPDYPFAYLGRAQINLAQGRIAEAFADFDAAVKNERDDYAPFLARASALWALGRKEEAASDYQKALSTVNFPPARAMEVGGRLEALRLWPSAAQAYSAAYAFAGQNSGAAAQALLGRARAYAGMKDSKKALKDIDDAARLDRNNPAPWLERGRLEMTLGSMGRAKSDLNRALKLAPGSAAALLARGKLRFLSREYPEAMADFNAAIAADPKLAKAYNDRGVLYFEILKNKDKALSDLNEAIALNPQDPESYFNMGLLLLQGSRPKDAVDALSQSLLLKGPPALVLKYRADAYSRLGDEANALEDLQTAIEENSKDPSLYVMSGRVRYRAADYDEALRDFGQALDFDSDDAQAYFGRGQAYAALGSVKRAYRDISAAAEKNPSSEEIAAALCQIRREDHEPEAAVSTCDQIISSDPSYGPAYLQRGLAWLSAGRPEKALPDLTQALHLGPKLAQAYLAQAVAHVSLRQYRNAHEDFEQALLLDPEAHIPDTSIGPPTANPEAFYDALSGVESFENPDPSDPYAFVVRGDALYDAQHYDKAIAEYTKALQIGGAAAAAYVGRARCLEAESRDDEARQDLEKAIKEDPQNSSFHNEMAKLLVLTKSYPQAVEEEEKAVKLDLKNAAAYLEAGHIRYFMKDYAKAVDNYQLAVKTDPWNPQNYAGLGLGLFALKRYPEAIENFSEAIALDPTQALFYKNRGAVYADIKNYADALANFQAAGALNADPTMVREYRRLIQESQSNLTAGKS